MQKHDHDAADKIRRRVQGFTMVELLLVILIVVMASSIAVPSFVNSIKGARLRTSSRSVVMLNKYARNMAVLKQKPVVIRYDFERGRLELATLEGRIYSGQIRSLIDSGGLFGEVGEATAGEAKTQAAELIRKLEQGVVLDEFEGPDDQEYETGAWVTYYPNGMCDAHSLLLRDERELEVKIDIESITGEIGVTFYD